MKNPAFMSYHNQKNAASLKAKWAKRLGAGVFAFYFIKGMVWLGIFAAAGVSAASGLSLTVMAKTGGVIVLGSGVTAWSMRRKRVKSIKNKSFPGKSYIRAASRKNKHRQQVRPLPRRGGRPSKAVASSLPVAVMEARGVIPGKRNGRDN